VLGSPSPILVPSEPNVKTSSTSTDELLSFGMLPRFGIDYISAVIEKSNVETMYNTQWSLYTFGSIGVLYRPVRKD
jgi:hypothetical protein